ncbi:hypothetical protein SBA7_520010 [Candidatus Sulfotelmatobacter sp. SbA7]|nr:hypothetical protein SBA7_520010 [Candidatus Sulfotelmatobacter sp. SbA7]
MRFRFDERKSGRVRANPKRGIGFEEAQEVFSHPYYLDQRSDWPAIPGDRLGRTALVLPHFRGAGGRGRRILPPRDPLEGH